MKNNTNYWLDENRDSATPKAAPRITGSLWSILTVILSNKVINCFPIRNKFQMKKHGLDIKFLLLARNFW